MLLTIVLKILYKNLEEKKDRYVLEQFEKYTLKNNFDINNIEIHSQESIDFFGDFAEFWINQELNKNPERNFGKCLLLSNIFIILIRFEELRKEKEYLKNLRKIYEEEFLKIVNNLRNYEENTEIDNKNHNDNKEIENNELAGNVENDEIENDNLDLDF